jgi:hypothetical protein
MAKTIPQLTDATTVNAADELIVQQGGITKRATVSELLSSAANVKHYGAVGDGVADDTAAFVEAANTGKHIIVPSGTYVVTVANQTQADAVMGVMSRLHLMCDLLTINFAAGQYTFSQATNFNVVNADKLRIVGAAPVTTTITSIDSVTGSSGAYAVTANVADATNIVVGDVVLIKDVEPSANLPVASSPARPAKGALKLQFFNAGSATLSLSSTSGSISQPTLTNVVANGDLLLADGRIKAVSSVSSNAFAIDATHAPPKAYTGKQYWYSMRESERGVVSVSGTAVTGVNTQFTNDANVGDIIAFNGGGMRQIVAINSDSSLTLSHSHPAVSAITYGIVAAGETHDGAWVVTNVVGNAVTWTNTFKKNYGPPKNLVVGGSVVCLKTIFVYSATSGFTVNGGSYTFKQIGLRGPAITATVGIDLRGASSENGAHVIASDNVGVNGFGYGCWLSTNAGLQANNSFWCGQHFRSCNVAGGEARLQGAVIAGAGGIGVLVSEGAFARLAATKIHGCSLQGLRMEVGGSTWADFAVIGHNNADNVLMVGGVSAHLVGLRSSCAGGAGVFGQNGGYGRASGALLLCNDNDGTGLFHAQMECNQLMAVGNKLNGATVSRGDYSFEAASFGYNGGEGLLALRNASVSATTASQFVGNANNGVSVTSIARVFAENAGFSLNATASASAVSGGQLLVPNYEGTNNFSPVLNKTIASGAYIADQTSRPDILSGSKAHNFGSISAGAVSTTTVAVANAGTSDAASVSYNGSDVTGLVVTARVSAPDEVTVYAANISAAPITVSNRTYFVKVHI